MSFPEKEKQIYRHFLWNAADIWPPREKGDLWEKSLRFDDAASPVPTFDGSYSQEEYEMETSDEEDAAEYQEYVQETIGHQWIYVGFTFVHWEYDEETSSFSQLQEGMCERYKAVGFDDVSKRLLFQPELDKNDDSKTSEEQQQLPSSPISASTPLRNLSSCCFWFPSLKIGDHEYILEPFPSEETHPGGIGRMVQYSARYKRLGKSRKRKTFKRNVLLPIGRPLDMDRVAEEIGETFSKLTRRKYERCGPVTWRDVSREFHYQADYRFEIE